MATAAYPDGTDAQAAEAEGMRQGLPADVLTKSDGCLGAIRESKRKGEWCVTRYAVRTRRGDDHGARNSGRRRRGVAAGREIYACRGVTSLDDPLPVDRDTLYEIGSVTKTYTATALMRLVAAERVELDAQVRRYVSIE